MILFLSFLFFALLTPVMFKAVLPLVMESQFPTLTRQALEALIVTDQTAILQSYLGDVFEIGSIIVAFTLCGLLAQEIADRSLVLPLCAGKKAAAILWAKFLVFGAALLLAATAALLVCYLYSGLLFSFEIGLWPVLRSGLLQGFFMAFLLACLLFWGALVKKTLAAGLLSLGTVYGLHAVGGILRLQDYLPVGLLVAAAELAPSQAAIFRPLAVTAVFILSFVSVAVLRLRRFDWNDR